MTWLAAMMAALSHALGGLHHHAPAKPHPPKLVSYRAASVQHVICGVFGPYCQQALRVAWCESRFRTTAVNGQYLGLFQMGDYARSRYGFGQDAWTQSEGALRYFIDAGWSWEPWECRP